MIYYWSLIENETVSDSWLYLSCSWNGTVYSDGFSTSLVITFQRFTLHLCETIFCKMVDSRQGCFICLCLYQNEIVWNITLETGICEECPPAISYNDAVVQTLWGGESIAYIGATAFCFMFIILTSKICISTENVKRSVAFSKHHMLKQNIRIHKYVILFKMRFTVLRYRKHSHDMQTLLIWQKVGTSWGFIVPSL